MSNGPPSLRPAAPGEAARSSKPRRQKLDTARASLPVIRAVGRKLSPHEDFYHWVLTLTWKAFFAWVTIAYFATNALFALAYLAVPGSVANVHGFFDAFFFSVETLATIGYGVMAPQTGYAHAVVTFEALAGILATATITGVTFARFARPTAKVIFSEKAVIANRDGIPHLQFRIANWRRNQIAAAQLHVMVLVIETTAEGETIRVPTPLDLVRDMNPMFVLTWTAMHRIEPGSPFYGPDAFGKLRASKAELFLNLTGTDETIGQTIHTRYRYRLDDIVHNARFSDILEMGVDDVRIINFDKFHEIELLGDDAT